MARGWITYKDAVEHVLLYCSDDRSNKGLHFARMAVDCAIKELCGDVEWNYYKRSQRLSVYAPQTTGTVEYTASTRTLTLTGATWPTYAATGRILIGDISYDIQSYDSTTELTLESSGAPAANIASGTSYTLYFADYDLPDNVLRVGTLIDLEGESQPIQVGASDWSMFQQQNRTFRPTHWTVMSSPNTTGVQAIRLAPAPDAAREYEYIAKTRPRTLRYERITAGTISTAASSTQIDGSNTAFTDGMVGAIMRISTGNAIPGNRYSDNPAAYEFPIKSVTDATTLDLETSIPETLSDVKYVISDPVDVNQNIMDQAFFTLAELRFLERVGPALSIFQDPQQHAHMIQTLRNTYMEQYHQARGADSAYRDPFQSLSTSLGYMPDAQANDSNA